MARGWSSPPDPRLNGGARAPGLGVVAREWGRIGSVGFGGPPAHIALLRACCVEREGGRVRGCGRGDQPAAGSRVDPAGHLLRVAPARRGRGARRRGLLHRPGLALIMALAALFLAGSPPAWVSGAGAGAGAAVTAVAVHAGMGLAGPSRARAASRRRWLAYVVAGALTAAAAGPGVVLVLLGCGFVEVGVRRGTRSRGLGSQAWGVLSAAIRRPVARSSGRPCRSPRGSRSPGRWPCSSWPRWRCSYCVAEWSRPWSAPAPPAPSSPWPDGYGTTRFERRSPSARRVARSSAAWIQASGGAGDCVPSKR